MIDITKAIRIEKIFPHKKRPNWSTSVYILKCSIPECNNEIRVQRGKHMAPKGKCRVCSSRKKPYLFIFNLVKTSSKSNSKRHKGCVMTLTYEEFLEFTKIDKCHYCDLPITWLKWTSNKTPSGKYNLDKKDPTKGYSKENCVVCCTSCNFTKSARFSYEEFLLLSEGLKQITCARLSSPS